MRSRITNIELTPNEKKYIITEKELFMLLLNKEYKIEMEIGTGNGSFIIDMASKNKDKYFIGIDIEEKLIKKTARKIASLGLKNIFLLSMDIKYFIDKYKEKKELFGTIEQIYINFPDPWPKRKHRKRRFVNQHNLDFLLNLIAKNGYIYMASDSIDYIMQVKLLLNKKNGKLNVSKKKPYRQPLTKYEKKALSLNKPIGYIIYQK